MKKYTFVITIMILLMSFKYGYSQWIRQSPHPTARNLNGVTFISPTHIFASGQNHHLLESTNGGLSWITRMSDDYGSDPFYMVYFSDANHGYLTGNNNDAWRTTNAGVTWIPMIVMPGSWSHIDFITPTQGFLGANGALAFTSNGGISWQAKSAYPSCPVIYGMDFKDLNTGIAGGILVLSNQPGIFKTTDGGSTWVRKLASSANAI